MSWPTQRTAILVIHGIGQQSSFDTLDRFVRNLYKAIELENGEGSVSLAHHVTRQGDWAQNYISLLNSKDESNAVDCYEYFWAHETQRKIGMAGVFDWLVDTGKKAEQFYERNAERNPEEDQRKDTPFGGFARRGKFDKHWYLKSAGQILRVIQLAIPLIALAARIPRIGTPLKMATMVLAKAATPIVVDVIGDVALYTSTDRKSEYFPVRRRVINGAVDMIESLIAPKDHSTGSENDPHSAPEYGRVIVVGHSLGTAVGYDALNRVNNRMNARITDPSLAEKLDGFVTFGSPLDKIAYFFRGGGAEGQVILRQILSQNVGFRSKNVDQELKTLDPQLESHIEDFVGDKMVWINFWDPKDPISGTLDFFTVDENRRLNMGQPWGKAHVTYWEDATMFKEIIEKVLLKGPVVVDNPPADP